MGAESFTGRTGERYRASTPARLRFRQDPSTLGRSRQRALDPKPISLPVLPPEPQGLTRSESGRQQNDPKRVEPILPGTYQEPAGFLCGENAALLLRLLRKIDEPGRVTGHELPLYSLVQCRNLSTTMGHSTGLIREQCPVW